MTICLNKLTSGFVLGLTFLFWYLFVLVNNHGQYKSSQAEGIEV